MRLVPPCLVALVLAGCGFNFADPTLVVNRRILGMSLEPPEMIFGVSDFSQPIQVNALVVEPDSDGGAPQTFKWSWCLSDLDQAGGYDDLTGRCYEQSSTLVSQGAVPLADMATQFAPQTALNALIAYTQTSSVSSLESSLGSLGGEPTGGSIPTDGLSTYVLLQLDVAPGVGETQPLYGITREVLSTAGPGDRQPNHNPHLTALTFDDQIWEPDVPLAVTLKNCPVSQQTLEASAPGSKTNVMVCTHRIFPVFDPSQIETYQVQELAKAADGGYPVLTLQEQLVFNWYSDLGTFTEEFTGTQSNLGPQEYDPYSTEWIEPPSLTTTTAHFWIVTQDDRGGESWDERTLTLSGD